MAWQARLDGRRPLALAFAALLVCGFVPDPRDDSRDPNDDDGSFGMTMPVACKEIRGFEDFQELPGAALTSDEKLLVYFRPRHYKSAKVGAEFEAHLTQDGRIRRRGEKAVLWSKAKLLDYRVKTDMPPQSIYMRNTISVKALKPGEYDYDITLHDAIGRSAPVVRTLPFTIVPAAAPSSGQKTTPGSLQRLPGARCGIESVRQASTSGR
jgi:hypothetical protein